MAGEGNGTAADEFSDTANANEDSYAEEPLAAHDAATEEAAFEKAERNGARPPSKAVEPPVVLADDRLPARTTLPRPPVAPAVADDEEPEQQEEGSRHFYTAVQEQAVMDWVARNPRKADRYDWKKAMFELAPYFPSREKRRPYKGNDLFKLMEKCRRYDVERRMYPNRPPQLWGNERAEAEKDGTWRPPFTPRTKKAGWM